MRAIAEYHRSTFARMLEAVVAEQLPDARFDGRTAARSLERQMDRRLGMWLNVNDSYVEKD